MRHICKCSPHETHLLASLKFSFRVIHLLQVQLSKSTEAGLRAEIGLCPWLERKGNWTRLGGKEKKFDQAGVEVNRAKRRKVRKWVNMQLAVSEVQGGTPTIIIQILQLHISSSSLWSSLGQGGVLPCFFADTSIRFSSSPAMSTSHLSQLVTGDRISLDLLQETVSLKLQSCHVYLY